MFRVWWNLFDKYLMDFTQDDGGLGKESLGWLLGFSSDSLRTTYLQKEMVSIRDRFHKLLLLCIVCMSISLVISCFLEDSTAWLWWRNLVIPVLLEIVLLPRVSDAVFWPVVCVHTLFVSSYIFHESIVNYGEPHFFHTHMMCQVIFHIFIFRDRILYFATLVAQLGYYFVARFYLTQQPEILDKHILMLLLQSIFLLLNMYILERERRCNFLLRVRLERTERQWREMVEFCPDGLLVHTQDKIIHHNTAARDILGVELIENVNVLSESLIPVQSPDSCSFSEFVQQIIQPGAQDFSKMLSSNQLKGPSAHRQAEYQLRTFRPFETDADYEGISTTVLEVNSSKMFWYDSPAALVVVRNITKLREMQQKKREEKARKFLVAALSHELRTPLNAILGMLQFLMSPGMSEEETQQCLKCAYMSGNLLLNLINDVLDLSRIKQGTFTLNTKPFDLVKSVQDILDLIGFQAHDKGLQLNLFIDESVPKLVLGDKGRLQQIVLNLLANSVKFTYNGSVSLTVGVKLLDSEKHRVSIWFKVSDTGIGMKPEDIESLFCFFSKLNDSRVDNSMGMGLGLSISKQLCQLMGGDISVESRYGEGSTFTFDVQFEICANQKLVCIENEGLSMDIWKGKSIGTVTPIPTIAEKAVKRSIDDSSQVTGSDGSSLTSVPAKHILIVEDNSINAMLVSKILTKNGYAVTVAENGYKALQLLNQLRPFHAVLMDGDMPVMDGFEATKAIRQLECQSQNRCNGCCDPPKRLPVIGLTAFATDADRERCLACGMDEFIAKPFRHDMLLQVIERFVGGK